MLAGYPLVDFQAEVYDGSHHAVDSSDIAFQVAGSIAFQKVAREAGLALLEPIMEVRVETPEAYMGEVIADLDAYITPSWVGDNLLLTNLTGHPCVVVPNGFRSDGTPTSITFMGRRTRSPPPRSE